MLEGVFLQAYGFFGGSFGNVLAQWEQAGVFSYILPFLLIFALIFGILQKMKLFGETSKAINGIIALSVGLMALQFGFVSQFFAQILPNLGIGIAVILVGLILVGLFTDQNQTVWFFILGVIVLVFVLWNSFDFGNYTFSFWFTNNFWNIFWVVVILAIVLGFLFGPFNIPQRQNNNPLARALLGQDN